MKRKLTALCRTFVRFLRRPWLLPTVTVAALSTVLILGGVSLGRYIHERTYSTAGQVSAFLVKAGLDDATLSLVVDEQVALSVDCAAPDPSATCGFYLTSKSAVRIGYTVRVTLSAPLPVGVVLTLSDGTNTRTLSSDGASSVFDFTDIGTIEASESTERRVDFTLTFSVPDTSVITSEVHIPTARLTVYAEQVFS